MKGLRLLLCGWCFSLILWIVPESDEGWLIIKCINQWASETLILLEETKL